jgi:hypothetical protein
MDGEGSAAGHLLWNGRFTGTTASPVDLIGETLISCYQSRSSFDLGEIRFKEGEAGKTMSRISGRHKKPRYPLTKPLDWSNQKLHV